MGKTFEIPMVWEMTGIIEVEAETLDEALDKAEQTAHPIGEYRNGSYEILPEFFLENNYQNEEGA